MKSLDTYVEELLYRHQCVIVPEFGAFVSNRKVAELMNDKSFTPPQKELTFNSRLTYNDGLVATHISKEEHISYEDSQKFIADTVQEWKKELKENQALKLDVIGDFRVGPEDTILFTPSDKENFLTDSFGMSTFTPNEVDKTQQPQEPAPVVNEAEALEENPMITPQEEQQEKGKRKIPALIKYAAVAIVAISIISYATYTLLNNNSQAVQVAENTPDPAVVEQKVNQKISEASFLAENPLELSGLSLTVKKDPNIAKKKRQEELQKAREAARKQREEEAQKRKEEAESLAQAKAEEAQKRAAEKAEKAEKIAQTKAAKTEQKTAVKESFSKFNIIAGAFGSEKNAKTRVKQLKNKGFGSATIIGKNDKGLFLVSYKGFSDQSQADAFLQKIKAEGNDGWILAK